MRYYVWLPLIIVVLFFIIAVGLFATGISESQSDMDTKKAPVRIRFVLDWTPNTNHTGVFVAKEKGFFSERNIEVEILPFSDMSVELLVGNNQAEFGVSYQEGITFARSADEPIPIVAVATIIQHNTSGFASLKKKNIRSPKDFVGKKYGAYGSPVERAVIDSLLDPYNADADDVVFIQAGAIDFFAAVETGLYDFAWIFEGWTGMEAQLRNQDLNFQLLADYDTALDYYTPVIISSETFLNENPNIAKEFLQAVREGYEWTIKNSKEAAVILSKSEPALNKALLEKSLEYLAPRFQDDAAYWGKMESKVWIRFTQWLQDNEFISKDFDIEGAYTNAYIQQTK